MTSVEILDTPWLHEDKHRQVFTDIFMFSSEERHRVKLRLGQLSHNLFKEEYPQGAHYITPIEEGSWLLDIEVCDYRGLGRFVLGLFKDIRKTPAYVCLHVAMVYPVSPHLSCGKS